MPQRLGGAGGSPRQAGLRLHICERQGQAVPAASQAHVLGAALGARVHRHPLQMKKLRQEGRLPAEGPPALPWQSPWASPSA